MSYPLPFTGEQVKNIIDGRYNSFRETVYGTNSTTVTADTEFLFVNNGATSSEVTSPDYITSRWDTTNSKMAIPEEYDTPTYVFDMASTYTPSGANLGSVMLRVYVDESGTRDFSTDPNIRTYTGIQKGTGLVSIIATWFFGDNVGYDAKNKGVYFTLEFENAGTLSSPYHTIYRT